jgi:hypothetical protein
LGFEIEAVRRLLAFQDQPERSCGEIDELTLAAIDQKIASLVTLREEVGRMLSSCPGGRVADCRIVTSINHGALPL